MQCGRTIPGLNQFATARCRGDTSFGGDNCVASCLPGYDGPIATYVCNAQGQWKSPFPISCKPTSCSPSVDPALTHPNALLSGFCPDPKFGGKPCTVKYVTLFVCTILLLLSYFVYALKKLLPIFCSCATGYYGGPVNYTCGADDEWLGFINCTCELFHVAMHCVVSLNYFLFRFSCSSLRAAKIILT